MISIANIVAALLYLSSLALALMSKDASSIYEDRSIYEKGQELRLALRGQDGPATHDLVVKVERLMDEFTMSCCMVVRVQADPQGGLKEGSLAFLKLYDWRCAAGLRQSHESPPLKPSQVHEYVEYVKSGEAAEWVASQDPDSEPDSTEPDSESGLPIQTEAEMAWQSTKMYSSELEAYDALRDIQGTSIPRHLRSVTVRHGRLLALTSLVKKDADKSSIPPEDMLDVKGHLLEYVDGFRLRELAEHRDEVPEGEWQRVVDDAMSVIDELDRFGVLNTDVKTRNYIVRRVDEPGSAARYQPVMVDLGLCKFRHEYGTEEAWGRAKYVQDEKGAVALPMRRILRKATGFQLKYQRSDRFAEYAPR